MKPSKDRFTLVPLLAIGGALAGVAGAQQQQEPVPDSQAALVFARGIEEVANRREDDGRRLATLHQVQQERHARRQQAGEQPRMKKRHLDEFASTTRSA